VPCTLRKQSYKCLVVQGVVAGNEYVSRVGQLRTGGARLIVLLVHLPQRGGWRSSRAAVAGAAKSRQPAQPCQRADVSLRQRTCVQQSVSATIPEPSATGHGACNIRVLSTTPPWDLSARSYCAQARTTKNDDLQESEHNDLATRITVTPTLPCDKVPSDYSERCWHSRRNLVMKLLLIQLLEYNAECRVIQGDSE
jgi:hypothetical protein